MRTAIVKNRRHQLRHPRLPTIFIWLAVVTMALSLACGNEGSSSTTTSIATGTTAGNGAMNSSPLQIQTVDILSAESDPPQISVTVTGIIPDSCTKAREPEVSRDSSTFTITIIGERPTGVACAQIVSPYEKSISLGTLEPGTYTVVVNGVSKDFTVS